MRSYCTYINTFDGSNRRNLSTVESTSIAALTTTVARTWSTLGIASTVKKTTKTTLSRT